MAFRFKTPRVVLGRYCAVRCSTFATIPGPASLPTLGHLHLFSYFGPFKLGKFIDAQTELYKKYGSLVQLKLGVDMVLVFEPKDVEEIFRNEGKYPQRPVFEALRKYRMQNGNKYNRMGLFSDNGEDWFHLRKSVTSLLHPAMVSSYFSAHQQIADDFIQYVDKTKDSQGKLNDFMRSLRKFTQEAIGVVCFGKRLGCLSADDSGEAINNAVCETLQAMSVTWLGAPLWKYFPTTNFRKLVRTQNMLYNTAVSSMNDARQNFLFNSNEKLRNPLIYELLRPDGPLDDPRDVATVSLELFQAGIETTATALGFTLYHLAKNKEAQMKLRKEIATNIGKLELRSLQNMPYLKACIKESMRLSPPAGGNGRILEKSLVLSGYEVPAGVLVICCHPVMSRCERHFVDADKFLPERWLRGSHLGKPHPFVSLSFGFGARMCPGRRIAQQEMMLCLIKIFQKYKVDHDGSVVGSEMKLNMVPDKPLNFTFIEC